MHDPPSFAPSEQAADPGASTKSSTRPLIPQGTAGPAPPMSSYLTTSGKHGGALALLDEATRLPPPDQIAASRRIAAHVLDARGWPFARG